MKVSVVLCSYNRLKCLKKACDSILAQEIDFELELLVGDDGSTDGSREYLNELSNSFPDIVKVFFREENCGLGKNWALLIKEAEGKYIASCDDDDYWHKKNKLQLQVDFLETHPEYGMVHTEKDLLIEPEKHLISNYYATKGRNIQEGYIMQSIFHGEVPICVSSSMMRNSVIKKHVPLNLYVKHKFNIQDWPTWIFISKYTKIGYIDTSTTTYRVGHTAISNMPSFDKMKKKVEKDQLMYQLICEHFQDDLEYDKEAYNQYKLAVLLTFCYKKGLYKQSKNIVNNLWNGESNYIKSISAKSPITFYSLRLYLHMKKYLSSKFVNYKK